MSVSTSSEVLELMEEGGGFSTEEELELELVTVGEDEECLENFNSNQRMVIVEEDTKGNERTVTIVEDTEWEVNREVVYIVETDSESMDGISGEKSEPSLDNTECEDNREVVYIVETDSESMEGISSDENEPILDGISSEESESNDEDKQRCNLDAVFGSDGVVGILESESIKSIVKQNGSMKMVLKEIEERRDNLKCNILVSAGNEDITTKDYKLSVFKSVVRKFDTKVTAAGGVFRLTSLVPRPKEQDPTWSRKSTAGQKLASERYMACNNFVYNFNASKGMSTPQIKQYAESSTHSKKVGDEERCLRTTKMFYRNGQLGGNKQRKIKLRNFLSDGIHLKNKTRKLIEKVCIRELTN
jgi:hypothetical protein